jgi:surface polysaccharide O-acyltransferase-like enzyme
MRPASERLAEVDLLRVVALAGVITIHCSAWLVPVNEPPTHGIIAALSAFARFSVPAFLVASGLVLYRAYGRPEHPRSFLKRRWTRVLLPWLLWIPVYLVFYLWTGQVKVAPRSMADWLASGPGLLYFLLLIAQFYVLLLIMPRSRWGLVVFTAGAFLVQIVLGWQHTYHPIHDFPLAWPLNYLAQEEAPYWAGYFAFGCLLGSQYERIRTLHAWWPVAALAVVFSALLVAVEAQQVPNDTFTRGLYAFFWPSMVPLTISTTFTLLWLGHWVWPYVAFTWPVLGRLSQYSLGIYLVHTLILDQVGPLTSGIPPLPRLALLVAISTLGSWPVVALLSRTSIGALAVGLPPPSSSRPPLTRAA